MKLQNVQRELSKYKNGTFFYMTWESSLPIKAKFKDKYVVTKIVRSQVRKGIKYTHTKRKRRFICTKVSTFTVLQI